jgi:hypothetical protein
MMVKKLPGRGNLTHKSRYSMGQGNDGQEVARMELDLKFRDTDGDGVNTVKKLRWN